MSLEEKVNKLQEDVHDIKNNHLTHIQRDIASIQGGMHGGFSNTFEQFKTQSKRITKLEEKIDKILDAVTE